VAPLLAALYAPVLSWHILKMLPPYILLPEESICQQSMWPVWRSLHYPYEVP
jgi:hypothetical protein